LMQVFGIDISNLEGALDTGETESQKESLPGPQALPITGTPMVIGENNNKSSLSPKRVFGGAVAPLGKHPTIAQV